MAFTVMQGNDFFLNSGNCQNSIGNGMGHSLPPLTNFISAPSPPATSTTPSNGTTVSSSTASGSTSPHVPLASTTQPSPTGTGGTQAGTVRTTPPRDTFNYYASQVSSPIRDNFRGMSHNPNESFPLMSHCLDETRSKHSDLLDNVHYAESSPESLPVQPEIKSEKSSSTPRTGPTAQPVAVNVSVASTDKVELETTTLETVTSSASLPVAQPQVPLMMTTSPSVLPSGYTNQVSTSGYGHQGLPGSTHQDHLLLQNQFIPENHHPFPAQGTLIIYSQLTIDDNQMSIF